MRRLSDCSSALYCGGINILRRLWLLDLLAPYVVLAPKRSLLLHIRFSARSLNAIFHGNQSVCEEQLAMRGVT